MTPMEKLAVFDGTHTHASGPFGNDAFLCGDSIEGETGDLVVTPSNALIDCSRCVRIIVEAKRWRYADLAFGERT